MRIATLCVLKSWSTRTATAWFVLLLLSLAASSSDSRLLELTKDFPWKFLVEETGSERHDLLPGSTSMDNATLRTIKVVNADASDAAHLRIEYKSAAYGDRDTASRDYETLIGKIDRAEDSKQDWNIVLQAQNDLHWLQSKCVWPNSPGEGYFRQAYANLISYVEATGVIANRALLCDCDMQCAQVAIDR